MKFGVKKADKFGWEGVKGWSVDIDDVASTSYIEIESEIPLRKNKKNDRVYMVIEGTVEFRLDGERYKVGKKEAIFIPRNTKYSHKPDSKVKLVEANAPAFDKDSEILINKKR